jgi:ABC-2 type transport system ATP-binding protein
MLQVLRLTKRYGALTALDDVSFEVRQGEVLGLLGPNGSGKSTTVKILMALLDPSDGTVVLDGQDALKNRQTYKAQLGYVPEEPHLYTYMTGPEYLRLIGRLRQLPDSLLDEKIDAFLQLLGLYDDRYQTLSTYSKGMRQKILIAAAVLHNPRVVILDEPFSGLDVSAARTLKGFVRALCDEGKIVVFSSHVLEVVEQVCSRVIILKEGRVVGHDSVDNLRSTLRLPSLDAVFAALVAEDDVAGRTRALIAAMKAS